jgi:hypothetical protein
MDEDLQDRIAHLRKIYQSLLDVKEFISSDCTSDKLKGFFNLGAVVTGIEFTITDLEDELNDD